MSDFDRLLFDGALVRIGAFRCPAHHPRFEDTGPIENDVVVFPRTSVVITHEGARPILTTPNVVMFYNRGQRYRRGRVSAEGDACEWFAFPPEVIEEAAAAEGAAPNGRPFGVSHGPSDARTYLAQRRLVRALCAAAPLDALQVEEAAVRILAAALRLAPRARTGPATRRPSTRRDHSRLADGVRELLARHFAERLTLSDIARALDASPFHMARVFRAATGQSIHAWREQLRLRSALDAVLGHDDLSTVALGLGYSSHSHFTFAFRRAFGVPPSAFRKNQARI